MNINTSKETMTVQELNREQLIELKGSYYSTLVNEGTFAEITGKGYDEPSTLDMANIDNDVPDELIFSYYEGMTFTKEDFFCTADRNRILTTIKISKGNLIVSENVNPDSKGVTIEFEKNGRKYPICTIESHGNEEYFSNIDGISIYPYAFPNVSECSDVIEISAELLDEL